MRDEDNECDVRYAISYIQFYSCCCCCYWCKYLIQSLRLGIRSWESHELASVEDTNISGISLRIHSHSTLTKISTKKRAWDFSSASSFVIYLGNNFENLTVSLFNIISYCGLSSVEHLCLLRCANFWGIYEFHIFTRLSCR